MENLIKQIAIEIARELKPLLTVEKSVVESYKSFQKLELTTVKEASKLFKVHENTIRNWIKSKELDSVRVGSKIYVKIKNQKI